MKTKLVGGRNMGFLLLGFALIGFTCASRSEAAIFQGLGDLPGGIFESCALDVSADGSVVVGYGNSALGEEAFRWTQATAMVGLGDLPGGFFTSWAFGVSADGSVVVGWGTSNLGEDGEAFRWTQATAMVGLGDLPGGEFSSWAYDVSADGSVIVGASRSAFAREAFRWTAGGGMVGLGDLPGGGLESETYAASADGSVVVGFSKSASGTDMEAFRWVDLNGNGLVDLDEKLDDHPEFGLGDLAGGIFHSDAKGVSADGSVVVGQSNSASGYEAFRWTAGGGMVGLGDLPGGYFYSVAWGVSADGSVVVGWGASALGDEVFIWDAPNGMRNLRDVLVDDYGVDLTGWTLTWALGLSADGLTISGYGINPDGNMEAWVVVIPGPGDVDGNGVVDGLDLTAVLTAWETKPGDPLWSPAADLDDNNIVDGLDLTEVISNWTVAPGSATSEAGRAPPRRGTARFP